MTTPLLWLLMTGPLALMLVALLPAGNALVHAATARSAALGTLATAIIAAALLALNGPMTTGAAVPGLGLWFDSLTAAMFLLVAFVGTIVVTYSRNYMAGDPGHARFTRWLCLTLAAILTVILSGNLVQLALAWVATSFALNQLLLFYRRPAAILAARKKFIASRIGDLCLIGAIALIGQAFGGLDYGTVFAGAAALTDTPAPLAFAGVLLAIAALLKSAQFPLHGWLLEVMETPTPVSALLHAGIINAGGFLLLRFSGLITHTPGALDTLALVGGFTALFASTVMLTQTSIKVQLAWSTIAQMGFMLLQCGLGAWPAALLHILAHSLYKAHAFLSSGSVIDIARASWSPSPGGQPHPARLSLAVVTILALTLAVGSLFGATITAQPGVLALGAIMLMGLTHLVAQAIDERPNAYVLGRALLSVAAVAAVWFGLQAGMIRLFGGTLPEAAALRSPVEAAIIIAVIGAFAAVTVLQSSFARPGGRFPALYVHLANGLYVNTIANRLVLRLWPTGA